MNLAHLTSPLIVALALAPASAAVAQQPPPHAQHQASPFRSAATDSWAFVFTPSVS